MNSNRLTPEEQAVLDASRRMYNLCAGGNIRAWRKAEAERIKAEARARRILHGITQTEQVPA